MNRLFVHGLAAAALLASCAGTSSSALPPPSAGGGDDPGRSRIYRVAPGQGARPPAPDTSGTLQVSATGEVEVEPDRARVAFAVETEAETAEAAAAENARRMDRVHRALRGTELPGLRLETFGYALQPRYAPADRGVPGPEPRPGDRGRGGRGGRSHRRRERRGREPDPVPGLRGVGHRRASAGSAAPGRREGPTGGGGDRHGHGRGAGARPGGSGRLRRAPTAPVPGTGAAGA
ncbi:MAG: DUF541 domain-containing protein, partial [Gemmatimonadetes bacterium]|nr:DUF541 domain-containing protein [Gemmatimonadota bacterium]NIR77827.1 DUF541 domain-containing protein [Gemmatimonadota bacterium]NIT86793.1 DUF541 domain-containing protein [Gemmatimonadota bacterium]NIU30200.1 DUF541 domain-containing protein [Gemmatimonadota bacterium]NIU35117.1 DUF541 domain-containing protein [Gemmatimonadota bacterium]